ncbi:hypothetical protein K7X08_020265 [Anisodus acutangulus]|uniref:RING-type domain-containing protein n=1 Tax=Anisodus acutangulus TaxID=402998 RepID=A0A9Q1M9V7_9SOLA|nr:hypothetical protein K7X08_020265 [Anisodus acutangulus]
MLSEQVRSMLYDVYKGSWGSLMNAANEEAGRKVKEKDEQLRQARTMIAQLEQTVRQLNYSGQLMQSRIRTLERRFAQQVTALQQAAGTGGSGGSEAQQEDADEKFGADAPADNSRNNKRKQVMGESSSSAAAAGTQEQSTIPMMNHFSVQPLQQQVTIPTNIFSVQPQQQVQQLPCQFSSALQLNFNNNQQQHGPTELDNLDKFMSRPFTSYTALLTEAIKEPNYAPIYIHSQVDQITKAHEAGMKVKEKDEQLRQARTMIAQLEQTVRQLNYSGQLMQSRNRTLERRFAQQVTALQQAAGTGGSGGSEAQQEDVESSFVDPNNTMEPPPNVWSPCRACNNAEAKTMIFPCRHLCLCATCSVSAAVDACLVCQSPKENVYEVILP